MKAHHSGQNVLQGIMITPLQETVSSIPQSGNVPWAYYNNFRLFEAVAMHIYIL